MDYHLIAGIIAFLLTTLNSIPYIVGIYKKKVRPERVSWLIWMLLGISYVWTAVIENGAILYLAGQLLGPVIVFVLAMKYGVGGKSKFDQIMLTLAILAIILLMLTHNTTISLLLALTADAIGMILTTRKVYRDPTSESPLSWGMSAVAGIFAIISLQHFTFETLLIPVYLLLFESYLTICIIWLPKKHKIRRIDDL